MIIKQLIFSNLVFAYASLGLFFSALILFMLKKIKIYTIYLLFLIILLLLALSQPKYLTLDKANFISILCLDKSISLSNEEQNGILNLARRIKEENDKRNIKQKFITFGSDIQLSEQFPEKLGTDSHSNLKDALVLALAIIKKNGGFGRIAVLSDGSNIKLDKKFLQVLKKSKIPVFIYYPNIKRKDWKILSFEGPKKIYRGIKIPFRLHYSSNFPGEVKIILKSNNKLYLEKTITIKNTRSDIVNIEAPSLEVGNYYFQIQGNGDNFPQNNISTHFLQVILPKSVIIFAKDDKSNFFRALNSQYIPIKRASWDNFNLYLKYPAMIFLSPEVKNLKQHELAIDQYLKNGGTIFVFGGKNLNLP